ncbi:MAG: phosphatase PAP2 family protein [Candidatus Kryptoniota bacterium]
MILLFAFWISNLLGHGAMVQEKVAIRADSTGRAIASSKYRKRKITGSFVQSSGLAYKQNSSEKEPYDGMRVAAYVGGGLAITAALLATDDETYEGLRQLRERSWVLSRASPVITSMGDGKFSLAMFSGFFLYHVVTGNERSMEAARLGFESFLVSGIATQILKNLFGRERPSMARKEGGNFNGPFSYFTHKDHGSRSIASYDAFPSGHTATIFAAATTIADTYPEKWVSYAAYGVASAVAISRIMERAHWASDCFVGGVIGVVSTKVVEGWYKNDKGVSVSLGVNKDKYEIVFSYKF